MSVAKIVKQYGPKTALAFAQVTGKEDIACNRLFDRIAPASDEQIRQAEFDRDHVGDRFQQD